MNQNKITKLTTKLPILTRKAVAVTPIAVTPTNRIVPALPLPQITPVAAAKAAATSSPAFYGEEPCEAVYKSGAKKGLRCKNNAYYSEPGSGLLCGVHSRKASRTELPKNPNAAARKEKILADREALVEAQAAANRAAGRKGDIICSPLRMMKEAPHVDGYRKIFPNFKHQGRKDGYGCSRLSPKSLGPVVHGQPGLPVALNLENFHQGSKCFESELGPDGRPGPDFYATQLAMFQDSVPHRHKAVAQTLPNGVNKNICKYWVWKASDGNEKYFDYFGCRQFYCNYYERLVVGKEADFATLRKMLDDGYNLQIIGYDGYDVRDAPGLTMADKLDACYQDTSRPFGHELVLFSLLVLSDPADYPWRKHKTEIF